MHIFVTQTKQKAMTHNFSDVPQTKRDIPTNWSYIKGILLVTGLWVALWIAFNIFQ